MRSQRLVGAALRPLRFSSVSPRASFSVSSARSLHSTSPRLFRPTPYTAAASLKLATKNLASISSQEHTNHGQTVAVPTYNRDDVREGIVHVGVGGFHRAHLAVYVHELLQNHNAGEWGICGVGLRPNDTVMRDVLKDQDHMYTVIERSASGSKASVVGSIKSFLYAPDNKEAVIAKMAHEDTKIVSLTITESGYYYNENTHQLQAEHPDIQHDLKNPENPISIFGFLSSALARRRDKGLKPFTLMSCDNMQKNGFIARDMLISFTRLRDPELAQWITDNVSSPNAMVDRITPSTSPTDIKSLKETFGIEDAWPVVTEPFMQWVIEDKFCNGRPAFEKVGVQVVRDVHNVEQFEKHKLRLLNASHSAMAYPGQLAGFKYVHEVMEHPIYRKFIWQMMQEEVKPLLPEIPGVDIDAYCNTLMERFSNPTIMDQIPRVALNASGKIPQFIMPSVAENIWVTGPFRRLCFVVGAWFQYIKGIDDAGNRFEVDDPMREQLQKLAEEGGADPSALLSIKNLFGDDLRGDKRFIDEVTKAMDRIRTVGVMKALPEYVD